MNKNWLYRILAIALVAMLALPMFAMAEEAAAFELGADGEATAAEQKLTTDLNPWDHSADINAYDDLVTNVVRLPYGVDELTLTVDMASDWLDYYVVTGDEDYQDWAMDELVCTKNTKKSVLTCDKHNHITIKKTGKATLTFKATDAVSGKKVTVKLKVVVKDTSDFKVRQEVIEDNEHVAKTLSKVWKIAVGAPFADLDGAAIDVNDSPALAESSVLGLVATVKDKYEDMAVAVDYDIDDPAAPAIGDAITYENSIPIANERVHRVAVYKSSNKGVVKVDPWTGEIFTNKVGNATITCSLYDVAETRTPYLMKTAKVKIKVVKNKSEAISKQVKNAALAYANKQDELYFGVQQAEFTKFTDSKATLKVTYFVANGTDTTYKAVYNPGATVKYIKFANPMRNSYGAFYSVWSDEAYGVTLVDAQNNPIKDGKLKINWKAHKVSTFSKTYTIDRTKAVDLLDPASALALIEFSGSFKAENETDTIWYFKGVEE